MLMPGLHTFVKQVMDTEVLGALLPHSCLTKTNQKIRYKSLCMCLLQLCIFNKERGDRLCNLMPTKCAQARDHSIFGFSAHEKHLCN